MCRLSRSDLDPDGDVAKSATAKSFAPGERAAAPPRLHGVSGEERIVLVRAGTVGSPAREARDAARARGSERRRHPPGRGRPRGDRRFIADAPARRPLTASRRKPTVNALFERVVALAQTLHKMDGDLDASLLSDLNAQIAGMRGRVDDDRQVTLLRRQRASLEELAERRRLAPQLESAALALANLRLDLIKVRTSASARRSRTCRRRPRKRGRSHMTSRPRSTPRQPSVTVAPRREEKGPRRIEGLCLVMVARCGAAQLFSQIRRQPPVAAITRRRSPTCRPADSPCRAPTPSG